MSSYEVTFARGPAVVCNYDGIECRSVQDFVACILGAPAKGKRDIFYVQEE